YFSIRKPRQFFVSFTSILVGRGDVFIEIVFFGVCVCVSSWIWIQVFFFSFKISNRTHLLDEVGYVLSGNYLLVVFQVAQEYFRNAVFDIGDDFLVILVMGEMFVNGIQIRF